MYFAKQVLVSHYNDHIAIKFNFQPSHIKFKKIRTLFTKDFIRLAVAACCWQDPYILKKDNEGPSETKLRVDDRTEKQLRS